MQKIERLFIPIGLKTDINPNPNSQTFNKLFSKLSIYQNAHPIA